MVHPGIIISCVISQVYVFDGKPPDMKSGELEKRAQRREGEWRSLFVHEISYLFIIVNICIVDTEKQLKEAEEEGNAEDIQK